MGARRLFVYGTLRAGQPAHYLLDDASPCRSEAGTVRLVRTQPRYDLYDLGPYPALYRPGSTAVVGELYQVPESLFRILDEYEDHPEMYLRSPIDLEDGTDALAYFWNRERLPPGQLIVSGDWCAM